ncbi:MAG: hemerythrin family protein [SAR324 cluster bacterium]|nr:hemerythrin family protein [SAR324 cluster bacterium]
MMNNNSLKQKFACLHLGVTWLDHQHQVLREAQMRLVQASEAGDDAQLHSLIPIYMSLSKEHFDLEEVYMAENGYADFDKHKASHDDFLSMLEFAFSNWKIQKTLKFNPALFDQSLVEVFEEVPENLSSFLQFWNRQHSNNHDQAFAKFIIEKQLI